MPTLHLAVLETLRLQHQASLFSPSPAASALSSALAGSVPSPALAGAVPSPALPGSAAAFRVVARGVRVVRARFAGAASPVSLDADSTGVTAVSAAVDAAAPEAGASGVAGSGTPTGVARASDAGASGVAGSGTPTGVARASPAGAAGSDGLGADGWTGRTGSGIVSPGSGARLGLAPAGRPLTVPTAGARPAGRISPL
jgi:hypothetical protein